MSARLAAFANRHHPTLLAAANLLVGAGIAGIGLAPRYALALVASAVGGFGNDPGQGTASTRSPRTRDDVRAPVSPPREITTVSPPTTPIARPAPSASTSGAAAAVPAPIAVWTVAPTAAKA